MLAADKPIPDVPQAKLYIARCYEKLNNKEKAAVYYEETLVIRPKWRQERGKGKIDKSGGD